MPSSLRRNVFFVGALAMLATIFLSFAENHFDSMCRHYSTYGNSIKYCETGVSALLPAILIIPLSVILLPLRDEIFRAWLHFALGWIPLSIALILLASGSSGGGFGIPNVLDQESIAMVLAALFAIISLILIAYKYLSMRPDW
jgi:hypothetical protein